MPKISAELNQNKIEDHAVPHITREKKKNYFRSISQLGDDLTGADDKRSAPSVPNRIPSDNIKKMISTFESNAMQV
jgi:hypothetical protein